MVGGCMQQLAIYKLSVAKDLNQGRQRTNPASGQSSHAASKKTTFT